MYCTASYSIYTIHQYTVKSSQHYYSFIYVDERNTTASPLGAFWYKITVVTDVLCTCNLTYFKIIIATLSAVRAVMSAPLSHLAATLLSFSPK